MAREVEAVFPNVLFGVAPAILKEQLDDQLEKFIRSTSPERLMAEASRYKSSVAIREGMGMNYFLVSHFTFMHCGDLNSAHKFVRKLT